MEMIITGNANRTVSPTAANATSSRSHAVLQINVSSKDRNADVSEPHVIATLSIIDLAGSERASATLNKGERLAEGANINKSLLALGSCINALCDPRKKNHIPYRNSKLTRLLKFSLGGNCKTVMIVCVSPSSAHFDETQNTLRYANRAKNIQTKVTKNVYNVNRHVKDFLKKIDEQMLLINELRAQQKESEKFALVKFKKVNEKKESLLHEGLERVRAAFDHSAAERQEKVKCTINQRRVERRIEALAALIRAHEHMKGPESAYDDSHLQELSDATRGQLIELESSRRHFRQRLAGLAWDRNLDAALETGNRMLKEVDGAEQSVESAALIKEAEILRARAEREIMFSVLEAERGAGENGMVQSLMGCTLNAVSSLSRVLSANETDPYSAARILLQQHREVCSSELWRIIRPGTDARPSSPTKDWFPPTRSGTPRKRKPAIGRAGVGHRASTPGSTQKLLPPMKLVPPSPAMPIPQSTPVRALAASPKRRKIHMTGAARRGVVIVSGTPKKNKQNRKKGVTWKDDKPGTALAEFKTPVQTPGPESSSTPAIQECVAQESAGTFQQPPDSPRTRIPSPNPAIRRTSRMRQDSPVLSQALSGQVSSSSVPTPPELNNSGGLAAIQRQQNERMKMGFLQKKSRGPASPLSAFHPSNLTSSESESSPLRELKIDHASNRQTVPRPTPYPFTSLGLDGVCDSSSADESFHGMPDENVRRTSKLEARASMISPSLPRPSPLRKLNPAPRETISPTIPAMADLSQEALTTMSPVPTIPRLSIIEEQSVGQNLTQARSRPHRHSSGSSNASGAPGHDRIGSRKSSGPHSGTESEALFTNGQTHRMGGGGSGSGGSSSSSSSGSSSSGLGSSSVVMAPPRAVTRDRISYLLSPRLEGSSIGKVGASARKPGRRTTMLTLAGSRGGKHSPSPGPASGLGAGGAGMEMEYSGGRIRESIGVIGDLGGSKGWR